MPRGKQLKFAFDRALDRAGELLVVGDEDRLCAGVMFGLRQKIGGDPIRIAGPVGEDQNLGRSGDHVDTDLAENDALGRGDVGIARADDLGDRSDGRGAIGQRRDRLGAADAIDFVDAGQLCRCQYKRRQKATGCRHHHDEARHAGDLRRHRVHQHGRRIGGRSARYVQPHRLDRRPARAEFDSKRIGKTIVLRHLPAMKCLDARACERQRIERPRLASRGGRGEFLRCHPQPGSIKRELIELLRVLAQRRIAARRDVGHDRADGRLDVGRYFALGVEKGTKFFGEIGGARVQTDGHLVLVGWCLVRMPLRDAATPISSLLL